MDIGDARKELHKLEVELTERLNRFERETGVSVMRVIIHDARAWNGTHVVTYAEVETQILADRT